MLREFSKLYAAAREAVRPAMEGTISGPRGPITYARDGQGYPRIRARDLLDGTFARGYLHALDRMVQVHLSLTGARGRFMEVLGDRPFARTLDRATRTLDFARGIDEQVAAMRGETRALLQAYCDGFNAGAASRLRSPALTLAQIPAEQLTPAKLVLLYRFLAYFGLSSQQHVAEVVVAELAAQGVSDAGLELLLGEGARGLAREDLAGMELDDLFRVLAPAMPGGSNAFAVAGARTESGGALLMSEIHLELARIPPVLYAVHVDHDDGSYHQGIGVPGVAWLSAGRTPKVAWTYTFGHADNFDVLVERCRGGCYQAGESWLPLRPRVERVKVRGKPDERWVFYDGPYGTVVGDALTMGRYPCVRWSGLDQNYRDFDASRAMVDCTSVEELAELQRELRGFSACAVLADDGGRVARAAAGQVDQRPEGWAGVVPYPGWELTPEERSPAPRPEAERPLELDPADGLAVSANERIEGPGGACWISLPEPCYRHDRLRQRLEPLERVGQDDLVCISYDTTDLCAARLLERWAPHLPADAEAEALVRWAAAGATSQTEEERASMGLFHALHHEAVRALLEPHLGAEQTRRILDEMGLMLTFQHHLDGALALQRTHLLDAAGLKRVLAFAWPAARARVADGGWWAPVRERFKNVITDGAEPSWLGLTTEPVDLPGSPTAPFQARVVEFDGARMVGGPVNHMLFDLSRPGGWYNLAGGASESPLGPGYGAGIDDWLAGRFLPLGDPVGPPPRLSKG